MLKDVLESLKQHDGTCVSVILPTERGFQDHKKTDAVLKQALKAVETQLQERGEKKLVNTYMERLNSLTKDFDFASSQDGVGFFVNENLAERVLFPFAVSEKVIVDDSFEVRDLVKGVNRLTAYFALVLSKQGAVLYRGQGIVLKKVTDEMGQWGYEEAHKGGDDAFQTYLGQVDKVLGNYLNREHIPVIVVGVDKWASYFAHHSDHKAEIQAEVHGSYENLSVEKLGEQLKEAVDSLRVKRAEQQLERLGEALGANRYAAGIQQTWLAAKEGRVKTLLIEEGYHCTAYLGSQGYRLVLEAEDGLTKVEDAVDDLIEEVISKGGEVVFVAKDSLKNYQELAAILRF